MSKPVVNNVRDPNSGEMTATHVDDPVKAEKAQVTTTTGIQDDLSFKGASSTNQESPSAGGKTVGDVTMQQGTGAVPLQREQPHDTVGSLSPAEDMVAVASKGTMRGAPFKRGDTPQSHEQAEDASKGAGLHPSNHDVGQKVQTGTDPGAES